MGNISCIGMYKLHEVLNLFICYYKHQRWNRQFNTDSGSARREHANLNTTGTTDKSAGEWNINNGIRDKQDNLRTWDDQSCTGTWRIWWDTTQNLLCIIGWLSAEQLFLLDPMRIICSSHSINEWKTVITYFHFSLFKYDATLPVSHQLTCSDFLQVNHLVSTWFFVWSSIGFNNI